MKKILTVRKTTDSDIEKIMPFSEDLELRDRYINFFGALRLGKLLEDLDLIAGQVAYKHTDGWERELTIVTAACDRIDLLGDLRIDCDLQFLASINWVGKSSLEVGIKISSKESKIWKRVARAYFIMVARKYGKAEIVNSLEPVTFEEKRRFKQGKLRQQQRMEIDQTSYLLNTPTADESKVLHEIFLKIKNGTLKGIPMQNSTRQLTLLMHPQSRNVHNNIFGGYLMREAFELAWNITYLFCKKRPQFICMDHMYFYKPVEIGSIVSFTATVIYSFEKALMVEVASEVIHPKTGDTKVTNVCYFTFTALNDSGKSQRVPLILPNTYEEGLKYLDGAKRFKLGEQKRNKR
ncbi:MAG: hypothetical protein CL935_05200 [Deltaproteobacteria bacterium]|nr:hypothetical protein [Deltaproteobacteria bacterium]|tara:strand:- start:5379 stop:6428 length:1050 start_codon:yes stop_codon:yes gene_type:complete